MSKKRNYRLFLFGFLVADLMAAGALSLEELKDRIPDTVYIRYGQEEGPSGVSGYSSGNLVRRPLMCPTGEAIRCPLFSSGNAAIENGSGRDGGRSMGLCLGNKLWVCIWKTQGVLIVDTGEITNRNGMIQEPAANIVQPGDYILEVNGKPVSRKKELIAEIENCQGQDVELLGKP